MNDTLAELEPLCRLLFIGLWTIADRAGRLKDNPKRIKAEILPYDSCDINQYLNDLARYNFIQRYKDSGRAFIQVCKFTRHQHPHQNEPASTLPEPPEIPPEPSNSHESEVLPEDFGTCTEVLPEQSGVIRLCNKVKDNKVKDISNTQSDTKCDATLKTQFEQFWNSYPKRKDKKKAWERFKKVFSPSMSEEKLTNRHNNLNLHLKEYIAECSSKEERYIKYPATWLNSVDFDSPPEVNLAETDPDEVLRQKYPDLYEAMGGEPIGRVKLEAF